jgi:hypothetical protein
MTKGEKGMSKTKTQRIAELNDICRTAFGIGGRLMLTEGITSLEDATRSAVLKKVMSFDSFTADNDPYGEHDFGSVDHDGQRYFWKIDYYNRTMDGGSEDPSDPGLTVRVLTIMLASEY